MNSPLLPESAPFSAEQRQWLNGFLAGLANVASGSGLPGSGASASMGGAAANASVPASRPPARVLILFGSQSGNAEGLAHAFADKLKAKALPGGGSLAPAVMGMDRFQEVAWASETRILLMTSTWGDGDMPDNAAAFWDWLKGAEAPTLSHACYAVLGLGDRNYNRFCQAGRNLDMRLAELGARRLAPFCECDTDFEAKSMEWFETALAGVEGMLGDADALEAAVPQHAPANGNGHGHAHPSPVIAVKEADSGTAAPVSLPASPYGRKNPFPASLLENHLLNAKGSAKDTRHISLSLLGSGLAYKPGDALGVMPRNCYELVDRIILSLNCLGNEKVTLEGGAPAVLRTALLSNLDLRRANTRLLEHLLEDARNPGEKRRLEDLLAGDGQPGAAAAKAKEYLDDRDVLDVLEDFPHTRLEAQRLVACLGKLAPRLYSISSSPSENPGEVHLTVGIVRYEQDGRRRRGVASTFLAERVPLGMTVPVFIQPSSHFALPSTPGTPIIMVGPGTGIAPFRSFLQERRCLGDAGKNWLFFGDQRRQYDFLYAEECVAWQESGFLTRLDLAFSRDQEEKVYVQTRMLEQAGELWAWLEEGAHFYVCGDAKRMAKDVDAALHQVVAKAGGKSPEEAKAYVDGMKSQKRYLRDVY